MRRIFVCGSLRKGEFNHERFKGFGDNLVAIGTISGVHLKSLGDYPALVPSPNVTDTVVGEVYEISDGLGEVIDRWEREAGYEVRPVQVTSPSGKVEAQAYFYGDPDSIARHPVVEGGDWTLDTRHPR
jgi:gamma-glutamylcyclotransferase (GGCT)/AIG2-like uncharacterized protein YtfP